MRIETARKAQKKCPDEGLAEVSDTILKKCAGVPLAIITVAGLAKEEIKWCGTRCTTLLVLF
jgi:hypothetical protein